MKGRQRHLDVIGDEGHLASVDVPGADDVAGSRRDVERGVVRAGAGIGHREHAAAGGGVVDAPRHARLDGENLDLEHVPGLGPLDMDGPGNDMAAPPLARAPLARRPEVDHVLKDLVAREAETGKVGHRLLALGGAGVGDGVDAHGLARLDPQHGLLVDGEPAPAHVPGRGGHEVIGLARRLRAAHFRCGRARFRGVILAAGGRAGGGQGDDQRRAKAKSRPPAQGRCGSSMPSPAFAADSCVAHLQLSCFWHVANC